MKRARDVREQLLGLMDRVEVMLVSNPGDHDAVRSRRAFDFSHTCSQCSACAALHASATSSCCLRLDLVQQAHTSWCVCAHRYMFSRYVDCVQALFVP